MTRVCARAVSRIALATCIFGVLAISVVGHASTNSTTLAPSTNAKHSASGSSGKLVKQAPNVPDKPLWTELNPAQQQALAPLADEWNKLTTSQKNKWLAISAKFPTLKPDQQMRMQDRMRDWVKLTPEQRRVARESYARTKKLDPNQKAAEWQQYQQLSEDQKKKLADDAAKKKSITNLPPASQTKGKLVPPPKPVRNTKIKPTPETRPANDIVNQLSPPPSEK